VTAPAVETTGLRKVYGATVALADLSMTVEAGEAFGFLGPNCAGKTTAVRLLLGLASATSGDGRVLGAPIGDRAIRRRVGYLPELFAASASAVTTPPRRSPGGAPRGGRVAAG
jgi:ABC-2 type transport system ATP-binding protein